MGIGNGIGTEIKNCLYRSERVWDFVVLLALELGIVVCRGSLPHTKRKR